ncbi:MAG TPA: hypothetical protein VG711_11305, partial [Phycisphaerales bacterium]|nr:hypothetical protein [Phycisphaerales bacterium]
HLRLADRMIGLRVKSLKGVPASEFHWQPQPKAQAFINELVADFLARCPAAADLARRMTHDTATRFNDWIDYIQVPKSDKIRARLTSVGFTRNPFPGAPDCYIHEGALFPSIMLDRSPVTRLAIKVDSVVDFLTAHHITDDLAIDGEPLGRLRRAPAFFGEKAELWAVERHGYRGFSAPDVDPDIAMKTLQHSEAFRRRTRDWDEDEIGLDHTDQLIDAAVADLGPDLACDLFFYAERAYWQSRNHAGRIQKARQDKLGLGWANHDHHTYRSSRHCFTRLVRMFEKLGFNLRERFYAGQEAGWGAQVFEHPVTGIVIFADVDLSPEEIQGDFSHDPLPQRESLGTVGLWCGLHGEAILQAGMHHLECQFDHASLRAQLEVASIKTMDPFTNFAYLRQAFTEGERWTVNPARIQKLVEKNLITPAQSHWFRMQGGAIGSHLENLERNDGYKGFNQQGVSHIIAKTDPRKQPAKPAPQHPDALVGA